VGGGGKYRYIPDDSVSLSDSRITARCCAAILSRIDLIPDDRSGMMLKAGGAINSKEIFIARPAGRF
jgi:hypothetical protein